MDNKSGHELAHLKVKKEDDKTSILKSSVTSQEYRILPQISVDFSKTGFIRLTLNECRNNSDAIELLNSPQLGANFQNDSDVLLLKFIINDTNTELDSKALFTLNIKCSQKSMVLAVTSCKSKNFSLYWKSKNIQSFLVFKPYNDHQVEYNSALLDYVEEFLGDSLKKGHLGLLNYVNTQKEIINKVELHLLADSRDLNLLLLAAEEGKYHIVKILLKLGISSDSPFKNINAQSIAYKNRHFQVLLLLLQSNLTYPAEIDINQCSDEIKVFNQLSCQLHDLILANNEDRVIKILDQNPQLRYFYNHKNISAAAIALQARNVEMYKFLTDREVFFGPHEDTEDIMENLEYNQRRELRELHHEHLQDLPEKHLNVILSKSFVGHDVPDAKRKVSLFHRAFDVLNGINLIRILLMVVAASKKFQIIFDFNRDSVQLIDPTATSLTAGVFYLSGRIYIGAKQLLQKISETETLATIAHEFCHYSVNLTYNNDAKPYNKNDFQSMQEFEEISLHCQQNMDKEEVIELVYKCYSVETHHAELIVRVPHLLALYHNQPEKLCEVSQIFKPLFDFYKHRVVPEMEKALPNIEESAEREIEEKDKKISKLIKILIILGIFSIFGIFMAGYIFHKPTYSFNSLSEKDQVRVKGAFVKYMGVNVKFVDLFSKNSTGFNELKSDEIAVILKGEYLNISELHSNYLNDFIFHKWGNLTDNLKQKFLNSNFTFQNESVRFRDLYQINLNIFDGLTSDDIKEGLKGIKLKVGQSLQNDTLFYVERSFKKSDPGSFDYSKYIDENFDFDDETTTILNNSYEEIENEAFDSSNNLECEHAAELIGHNEDYIDSVQAIQDTQESKLFILSSEAGTGKTFVFKQLSLKIKKMFPMQWVSYIDLKTNTKYFNQNGSAENVEKLLKNILQLHLKSEFENKIFDKFYKLGNVTILWNGFDEISPLYSNFVLNVVSFIQNNTRNVQYICTRPLYKKDLEKKLNSKSFNLVPLTEMEQEEFLKKYLSSLNNEENSKEGVEEVKKIVKYLKGNSKEAERDFNSPLTLILVAKTYKKIRLNTILNVYDMYEEFTKVKIQIWLDKGTIEKDKSVAFIKSFTNVINYHQKYAIRSEISQIDDHGSIFMKVNKLNLMQKSFTDLSYSDISRMGFLFVNGEYEIEFSHRTFAEFFSIQYLIEKIFLEEDKINEEEAEIRVLLFYSMSRNFGRMKTDFMKDFLKNHKVKKGFNYHIYEALTNKYKYILIKLLDCDVFEYMFNFLSEDPDVFIKLLHIEENETFYNAIYNPNNFGFYINVPRMKELLKMYLKNEEFDKIIKGKHQRGKVLSGILYFKLLNSKHPEKYIKITDTEEYKTELEIFGNLTYWESFETFRSFLDDEEQKELFKTATITKTYIYFRTTFNISGYRDLWFNFENLFTTEELKEIIGNAIYNYLTVYKNDIEIVECLKFLLQKAEDHLKNDQIHEMFMKYYILHEAVNFYSYNDFKTLWEFYSNHTSQSNQRIVLDIDYEGNPFEPPYFKIFHRALLCRNVNLFKYVDDIYKSNFIVSEMQDIVLSPIDFLPYYIFNHNIYTAVDFSLYISDLFKDNEKQLKTNLCKKIKDTKKTVFEFLESYPDDITKSINKFSNLISPKQKTKQPCDL